MLFLGLTGDIASGKSTVARWLVEHGGAAHIDADLLVRELYDDKDFARHLVEQIASPFYDNDKKEVRTLDDGALHFLNGSGTVDRRALAQWVFGDAKRLAALEEIVHPAVAALRAQKIEALRSSVSPPQVVVLEAVKLVESGQAQGCDIVWWITASREVQRNRMMQDRGMTHDEAELRLLHQPAPEHKQQQLLALGIPFVTIDNSGSQDELEEHLSQRWNELHQRFSLLD